MELKQFEKSVNFWVGKPVALTAFTLYLTAKFAVASGKALVGRLKRSSLGGATKTAA